MRRIFVCFLIFIFVKSEDVFYNINNRALHRVSDKFLSISIDPAVLLAGANLSDISMSLAKHLSPAYIRLAGPSTSFVKYLDNEEQLLTSYQEAGDTFYITPSMWFGINEWFNLADLTPVFGLNDRNSFKGVWDPTSIMPLLEMSDKFGVKCWWQLGYGCTNKTTLKYVEDLNILRQTLNKYPQNGDTWRVVGGDMSTCQSGNVDAKEFQSYIRDLDDNVDAIIWQSSMFPKEALGLEKAALWTTIPKDQQPVDWSSALEWGKKVGEAAVLEYDVIFREPRLIEMTHATPVYWLSYLHKKLMGTTVLDIRPSYPHLSTFAHCTKFQNHLPRSGAATLMIINSNPQPSTAHLRLGLLDKFMEIQSYVLTQNDTQLLLNGNEVTMDLLQLEDLPHPRLRRARLRPHLSLEVPPRSVSFFVLTGARFTVCNDNGLNEILEEMEQDGSSEEFDIAERMGEDKFNIAGRIGEGKVTLANIKKNILQEMETDKNFYKRTFIDKKKLSSDKPQSLQLTIKEIEDILKSRARAKALKKNIKLTSAELDMLVDKATLKIPKHFVQKRDINRVLLEEKANFYKNNLFDQDRLEKLAKDKRKFWKRKGKRDINMDMVKQRSEGNRFKSLVLEDFDGFTEKSKKGFMVPTFSPSTNDKYLKFLRSNSVEVRKEGKPCFEEWGFAMDNERKMKGVKDKRKEEERSGYDICDDLEDLDYGFYRKKRSSKPPPNPVKQQYWRNKLKYKNLIRKKKQIHKIQKRHTNLPFGLYKPFTPTLPPWRPEDIFKINQIFGNWPMYSWMYDQNLKNAIMKNKIFLDGLKLRQKRHIDENFVDLRDNEVDVDDPLVKPMNSMKIEPKKLVSHEQLGYLEKIIGQDRVKAMEDFVDDIKQKFNHMGDKVKEFFGVK